MSVASFDFKARPAKIIDMWKLDEATDQEYPAEVLSHENVLRLNRTATRIWQLINGTNDCEEIIAGVCASCEDADADQVRRDLVAFLADLASKMMIVIDPDPLKGLD